MEEFWTDRINSNRLEIVSSLERLKILQRKVRRDFLSQLYPLITDWEGQLPNLRDIFRPEEVDWLLTEAVLFDNAFDSNSLIDFVIDSGYKDEPIFDKDGKPLLRRTTPLHHAANQNRDTIHRLFQIYNRFELNYTDESGLSHFHVACMNGFDDVVKRFLELGQDPNCILQETGDSPLHLALNNGNEDVVESLLRNGANPDLVNKDGLSSLHLISYTNKTENLIQVFFDNINEKNVQVDALDKWGNTPLHLALLCHNAMAAKCLLTRNSNPNLADSSGWNVWHTLCQKYTKIEWDKIICENCNKRFLPLAVNSLDKKGLTPLNYAIMGNNLDKIKMIIRRGACPNKKNLEGLSALNLICKKNIYVECFDALFSVSEEMGQTIEVNSTDLQGQTPLHWAVTSLDTEKVEKLLKVGVKISTWTFPKVTIFKRPIEDDYTNWSFRIKIITSLLQIIKMIEAAGYDFDKYDALCVMKFLEKNDLDSSSNLIDKVRDDSFINAANEDIFTTNLINGNERQIFRSIELEEIMKLSKDPNSNSSIFHDVVYKEVLKEYIIEKLLKHQFYHQWAQESFNVLFPGRLSPECTDMILEQLTSKELRTLCYAEILLIYNNHELVE